MEVLIKGFHFFEKYLIDRVKNIGANKFNQIFN